MKKNILPLIALTFLFCRANFLVADDATKRQAEKVARDFFQSYIKIFDSGDAKALSAYWKNDGEIVDAEGMRTVGRAAIEKTFAEFFEKNSNSKITIELLSARSEGDGVIVAEICPKIDPPISKSVCQVGAMVVLVKDKDGKWAIEGVREKQPLPASYEQLKQMQWMVGDWTVNPQKAEHVTFSAHCHWTENKSFLIRMYTFKYLDTVRHGTEVIGWDAKEKKIHSWMFDSSGGFLHGFWKKDGKRWTIDITGTNAEGKDLKATHVITPLENDAFTFESKNRMKGNEKQPDIPFVEMQRVKSHLPRENDG